MKPTFLKQGHPMLTVMLDMEKAEKIVPQMRKANADGADAYGVELNRTPVELLNEEALANLFCAAEGRPIYVTCYAKGTTEKLSFDEREEMLRMAVRAGATLVDVMAGWYDPASGLL